MEEIDKYEYNKINYFNYLNKMIRTLETDLMNYFFANIKEDDLNGQIEIPLVWFENSDYQSVKEDVEQLRIRIKNIDKLLSNLQSFSNIIVADLKDMGLTKEEEEEKKKEYLDGIKNDLINERKILADRINLINEDPKYYLRFKDFKSSNFSKVENPQVRKRLKNEYKNIMKLQKQRDRISKSFISYQSSDTKNTGKESTKKKKVLTTVKKISILK